MPLYLTEDKRNRKYKKTKFGLSGGFDSGVETARFISKLSQEYKTDPKLRSLTVSIIRNINPKDYLGQVNALYKFVKNNVRFVRDIAGVETLQSPWVTLPEQYSNKGIGAGDCDDQSLLLVSMLQSVGFRDLKLRVVNYLPTDMEYRHIYAIVTLSGKDYPIDTVYGKGVGAEVKHFSHEDINV